MGAVVGGVIGCEGIGSTVIGPALVDMGPETGGAGIGSTAIGSGPSVVLRGRGPPTTEPELADVLATFCHSSDSRSLSSSALILAGSF